MKTTQTKQTDPELQSRPEHLIKDQKTETKTQTSTTQKNTPRSASETINNQQPKRILPHVDFALRQESRSLPSEEVLEHLRRWYPQAYDLAEMVGRWIWITFPEAPSEDARAGLSQIGFHWNNVRKCWQHPCGHFTTTGTSQDPRQKYGSHFPADLKAA